MVIRKGTTVLLLGCVLLSASCVPPKAEVVEAAAPPTKKVEKTPEPEVAVETPLPPLDGNDGLRVGEMLDLPTESDFRATNPTQKPGDSGAVISRPPTDPPSRVKPKEEEAPKSD